MLKHVAIGAIGILFIAGLMAESVPNDGGAEGARALVEAAAQSEPPEPDSDSGGLMSWFGQDSEAPSPDEVIPSGPSQVRAGKEGVIQVLTEDDVRERMSNGAALPVPTEEPDAFAGPPGTARQPRLENGGRLRNATVIDGEIVPDS